MEYGHNLAKDGTSSVKIHHQPGGASSFSLGHDTGDDDRWGNKAKAAQAAPVQQQQQAQEEEKQNEPTAAGAKTSVKYSGNPPGGRSNFTLG